MDELKDILELMKREEVLLDLLDEDDRLMSQQQKENDNTAAPMYVQPMWIKKFHKAIHMFQ